MSHPHHHLLTRSIDFWLARGAVLVIVALQSGLVNDLTIGPRWLAPCLELALLIPLSIVTAWTQKRARKATTNSQWTLVGRDRKILRRLAIALTALVTLMNFGALGRLIAAILAGQASSGARERPWALKPPPIDYERRCFDQLNPPPTADIRRRSGAGKWALPSAILHATAARYVANSPCMEAAAAGGHTLNQKTVGRSETRSAGSQNSPKKGASTRCTTPTLI
jgi:hypothetical protein